MKKKNRPIGCYPSRYLTKFLGALNFSIRWWEPPFERTDPRRNETTKTYFTGHWLERGKLSCKVSRYHRRAGHKGSPGRVSGWLVGIEKNSRRLPGWQVIKAGTSTVPGRGRSPRGLTTTFLFDRDFGSLPRHVWCQMAGQQPTVSGLPSSWKSASTASERSIGSGLGVQKFNGAPRILISFVFSIAIYPVSLGIYTRERERKRI